MLIIWVSMYKCTRVYECKQPGHRLFFSINNFHNICQTSVLFVFQKQLYIFLNQTLQWTFNLASAVLHSAYLYSPHYTLHAVMTVTADWVQASCTAFNPSVITVTDARNAIRHTHRYSDVISKDRKILAVVSRWLE